MALLTKIMRCILQVGAQEEPPPVYNTFLAGKSLNEIPFSKVSPGAYYPGYTQYFERFS